MQRLTGFRVRPHHIVGALAIACIVIMVVKLCLN